MFPYGDQAIISDWEKQQYSSPQNIMTEAAHVLMLAGSADGLWLIYVSQTESRVCSRHVCQARVSSQDGPRPNRHIARASPLHWRHVRASSCHGCYSRVSTHHDPESHDPSHYARLHWNHYKSVIDLNNATVCYYSAITLCFMHMYNSVITIMSLFKICNISLRCPLGPFIT